MKRISTFAFHSSRESLKAALASGKIPTSMLEPLSAVVAAVAAKAGTQPMAYYLLSGAKDKEIRDLFGFMLAKSLSPRFDTSVLVDCDFLDIGLSGVVPQRDALGFLDFLLYGSSLRSVIQEASGGVKVVGAGSFQVTKKMPFAVDAFETAVRLLLNQAQLAVFCGPAEDDEGELHSSAKALGNIILVRALHHPGPTARDLLEEKLASMEDANVMVMEITLAEEAGVVERAPQGEEKTEPERVIDKILKDTSLEADAEKDAGSRKDRGLRETQDVVHEAEEMIKEPLAGEGSSLLPKIVTAVLAVSLVAFLFWWLFLTRGVRETKISKPAGGEPQVAAIAESTGTRGSQVPADTARTRVSHEAEPTARPPTEQAIVSSREQQGLESKQQTVSTPREEEPLGQPVVGTRTVEADTGMYGAKAHEIRVLSDLETFTGKYLIHVSSFRSMDRAQEDARYLAVHGFDVAIVHVDLKSKGMWYRVYVGPMDNRDKAREEKLDLEQLPRVKYTRITRVPGDP